MWGDWLEKGKELASKAQAVALDLDKQLNESVGIAETASSSNLNNTALPLDDTLNDVWEDDEDVVFDDEKIPANEEDGKDSKQPAVETTASIPAAENHEEPLQQEQLEIVETHLQQDTRGEEEDQQQPETIAEEVEAGDGAGWGEEDDIVLDDSESPPEPTIVALPSENIVSMPEPTIVELPPPVVSDPNVERKEEIVTEVPSPVAEPMDESALAEDENIVVDGWSGHEMEQNEESDAAPLKETAVSLEQTTEMPEETPFSSIASVDKAQDVPPVLKDETAVPPAGPSSMEPVSPTGVEADKEAGQLDDVPDETVSTAEEQEVAEPTLPVEAEATVETTELLSPSSQTHTMSQEEEEETQETEIIPTSTADDSIPVETDDNEEDALDDKLTDLEATGMPVSVPLSTKKKENSWSDPIEFFTPRQTAPVLHRVEQTATPPEEEAPCEDMEQLRENQTHLAKQLQEEEHEDHSEEIMQLRANQTELTKQLVEVQNLLQQREEQLVSKTEQMTTIESIHENEKLELQQKIQNTKEEAKRRIQKAKERVEAMEARLQAAAQSNNSSSEESAKQAEIIVALRSEGEKLAHKQMDMEKAVRSAKGEARNFREKLEDETLAKDQALEKIEKLQAELSSTQEQLASARRGESQADVLEREVLKVKEDSEMKAATILALEQESKELKTRVKELEDELEQARKGAAIETEREQKKLRKEHTDAISDLENKLRTSEREAAVREDALRHEVDELRRRWQDAVRRADLLSTDVQNSTGPLLRQLESAERQNRARSAAWAELENTLRSELEENVILNEKLSKERTDWKTKFIRLERDATDRDSELKSTKLSLEEKTSKVKHLEEKLEHIETEGAKMKEEWAEIDRLANEGVSRVRSEMAQTVVDLEDRHQKELEALQNSLQEKEEKCRELEAQIEEIIKHQGMLIPPQEQSPVASPDSKPVKLRQSDAQAAILAGALNGLGGDEDYGDDDDDDADENMSLPQNGGTGSYAAFAEYAAHMKSQTVELDSLKRRLAESELARENAMEELAESRNAKEKLPLFEAKVQELTAENREMSLEIQGLQEDIAEVRELYRSQLNSLLEEKTASPNDDGLEL